MGWGEPRWAAVPIRLAMGAVFIVSGYLKLGAIANTVGYFAKLGFPDPTITGWFIALLEFFGGIALVLGVFVRHLGALYTSSSWWPRSTSSSSSRASGRGGST